MKAKVTLALFLAVGGASMYMVVQSVWKGFFLVIGSILLDLGVDEVQSMWKRQNNAE